jgi:hypothetical protein
MSCTTTSPPNSSSSPTNPGREETLKQQVRLRFTAAEIRDGNTTIRAAVEHANITYQTAGQESQSFEWREGEAGPEQDRPLASLYRALGNTVFEIVIDANGNITEVSGLDRVPVRGPRPH